MGEGHSGLGSLVGWSRCVIKCRLGVGARAIAREWCSLYNWGEYWDSQRVYRSTLRNLLGITNHMGNLGCVAKIQLRHHAVSAVSKTSDVA